MTTTNVKAVRFRTYQVWQQMIQRCLNTSNRCYPRYGGRGITVCQRWQNSFEAFCEDMGEQPPGLSIERIDNAKGYYPGNCRWATVTEQNRNQRSNVLVTFRGETKCLSEWSETTKINWDTLHSRLKKLGYTVEEAMTLPLRKRRTKNATDLEEREANG